MNRAKNSARKFGGVMEDYLPLHAWFCETQEWVDGKAHYAFRHHTQGIFEAEQKFGYVISNSHGKDIPTRILCEIHIKDELGFIPTALEVIQFLSVDKWMGYRDRDLTLLLRSESKDQSTIGERVTQTNLK